MGTGFHVVIPARYASTRLPGKPLLDIAGVPMVVRVAEAAAQAGPRSVVVATDDERVVRACNTAGFEALLTRNDHSSGTDRVHEVAQRKGWSPDAVVVNVQGDEPLLPSRFIRLVAVELHNDTAVDVCTLREPIHDAADLVDANVVKVVTDRFDRALYFSRAAIPQTRSDSGYDRLAEQGNLGWRHVGLYAFRVSQLAEFVALEPSALEAQELLEQLRLLENGVPIKVLPVAQTIPGGVDTPMDLERVRSQLGA